MKILDARQPVSQELIRETLLSLLEDRPLEEADLFGPKGIPDEASHIEFWQFADEYKRLVLIEATDALSEREVINGNLYGPLLEVLDDAEEKVYPKFLWYTRLVYAADAFVGKYASRREARTDEVQEFVNAYQNVFASGDVHMEKADDSLTVTAKRRDGSQVFFTLVGKGVWSVTSTIAPHRSGVGVTPRWGYRHLNELDLLEKDENPHPYHLDYSRRLSTPTQSKKQ